MKVADASGPEPVSAHTNGELGSVGGAPLDWDPIARAEGLPYLLTVDEAATLFRVDRKTLYDAIQRKEVPGVTRIGRKIRLHRDTVIAWLSQGRVARRSTR